LVLSPRGSGCQPPGALGARAFFFFFSAPLLHPQFSSPQLGLVMPNPAASPLAHPRTKTPTEPGWPDPPEWDTHPCASHLELMPTRMNDGDHLPTLELQPYF